MCIRDSNNTIMVPRWEHCQKDLVHHLRETLEDIDHRQIRTRATKFMHLIMSRLRKFSTFIVDLLSGIYTIRVCISIKCSYNPSNTEEITNSKCSHSCIPMISNKRKLLGILLKSPNIVTFYSKIS